MRERVCAAILRGDRILMVRHVERARDFFTLPGGAIESGESPEEALARDVREETGLEVTVARPLFAYDTELSRTTCFLAIAAPGVEPVLGVDPELSPEEQVLREIAWRSLAEVRDDHQASRVMAALQNSSAS